MAALADVYSLLLVLGNTLGAIRVVSQGIPEGIRFQQIVCGDDHAMALAAKGQVYAWGSGAQGRTGSVADAGTSGLWLRWRPRGLGRRM